MTTIKIRPAKPLDTSNLVRLLMSAHDEAGAYPPVDQYLGLSWVTQTLSEGYVIVADVSGRLVGTLALTNYQFPWSPRWYMYLEWLYVQQKFRQGGAFEALIKACHAHADEKEAPLFMAISSADKDVFIKDRMIQQHGYQYLGGHFIRREKGGKGQEEDNSDVPSTLVC